MEQTYVVNLMFIFCVNALFFFSGIFLNSLIILSFWRSAQLRRKLCFFVIMVLSCWDLASVVSNHSLTAALAIGFLTEQLHIYPNWARIILRATNNFYHCSLITVFVLNFERYLATYRPIFHRTFVTKRKLLTLIASLSILEVTRSALMSLNYFHASFQVGLVIFYGTLFPPLFLINYKLFRIASKSRGHSKNISSCLLAVVCLIFISIMVFVYIGLRMASQEGQFTLDGAGLMSLWTTTLLSMNSTFNSLIFYWKNKALRVEGMKIINSWKFQHRVY